MAEWEGFEAYQNAGYTTKKRLYCVFFGAGVYFQKAVFILAAASLIASSLTWV